MEPTNSVNAASPANTSGVSGCCGLLVRYEPLTYPRNTSLGRAMLYAMASRMSSSIPVNGAPVPGLIPGPVNSANSLTSTRNASSIRALMADTRSRQVKNVEIARAAIKNSSIQPMIRVRAADGRIRRSVDHRTDSASPDIAASYRSCGCGFSSLQGRARWWHLHTSTTRSPGRHRPECEPEAHP